MKPPVGTVPGAAASLAPPRRPGSAGHASGRRAGAVRPITRRCVPLRRRGGWRHVTLTRPSRAAGDRTTVPPFLVVAAILLLGVNLRGPIVAVSPVLDTIS